MVEKQCSDTLGSVAYNLKGIKAFKDLDSESYEAIAHLFVTRKYTASQTVITCGDSSMGVYFVVSGVVQATMFSPLGREISYQDIGPGEMFGELAAIDHLPRSTHVIVTRDVELLLISGRDFQKLLAAYPSIALATLQKMAAVVRFLCDRVYKFGALDVSHRIRAELVQMATSQGGEDAGKERLIERMPKHQELANRLATHREAVSRELSFLEKAGIIEKRKHMLIIYDIDKLRSMVWD